MVPWRKTASSPGSSRSPRISTPRFDLSSSRDCKNTRPAAGTTMPTIETIVLFAGAALTLNVTPGPSIAYVMSRSFGQGRTAGLVSALGLGTGSLLHAIAATLGLSAIVAYSPMAYAVVKYLGAAYLVYLGVGLLRQRAVRLADAVPLQLSLSRVYWQGVLTEILNPKIALFFLSFLPQFVDHRLPPPWRCPPSRPFRCGSRA